MKFSSTRKSASAATCARRPAPTACRSSRRASRATTATRSLFTAGKAAHCTLCSHRLEKGQLPACVEACGIHAITLVDYDKPTEKTKPLIEKAVAMNEAAGTQPKVRYIAKHMDCKTFKMKL